MCRKADGQHKRAGPGETAPTRPSGDSASRSRSPRRSAPLDGRVSGVERWLAHRLLRAIGSPPVRLVLWNGEEIAGSNPAGNSSLFAVPTHGTVPPPAARIILRDRATFWKVFLTPTFNSARPTATAGSMWKAIWSRCSRRSIVRGRRPAFGQSRRFRLARRLHRARPTRFPAPAEHPPSLRHWRRLLPVVARPRDGL